MKSLSSEEWHKAVHRGLEEVSRRLASGELDQSGRYYTDDELATGAATGRISVHKKSAKASVA